MLGPLVSLGPRGGRDVIFPEAPAHPGRGGTEEKDCWPLPLAWAVAGWSTQAFGNCCRVPGESRDRACTGTCEFIQRLGGGKTEMSSQVF